MALPIQRPLVWSFVATLVLASVLIPSFAFNAMGTADQEFFENWQQDSEQLIKNEVAFQDIGSRDDFWGMGSPIGSEDELQWVERKQQIGTQGHFFSILNDFFNFSDPRSLQLIGATTTALIVSAFAVLFFRRNQFVLSGSIYFSALLSPWFVSSARNLYWIPWSWLLPALLAGLLSLRLGPRWTVVVHALLFLSFVFRFGAGYEFASSIILLAVLMPFLLDFRSVIQTSLLSSWKKHALQSLQVLVNSLAAFVTVLLVHSFFRGGGSIPKGFADIVSDVQRRTYGNPSNFPEVYRSSLEAGPMDAAFLYLFRWSTNLLAFDIGPGEPIGLGPNSLWILLGFLAILVVVYAAMGGGPVGGILFMIAGGIAIPMSWFIAAKGHSMIHAHINFVLWYPVTLAIVFTILAYLVHRIPRVYRERNLAKA